MEWTMHYYLRGTPVVVETLEIAPDHDLDMLHRYLYAHGVALEAKEDRILMRLPGGSRKDQLLPIVHTPRYRIQLPDGAAFTEILTYPLSTILLPLKG